MKLPGPDESQHRKSDPRSRFRRILAGAEEKPAPIAEAGSPLSRLPRANRAPAAATPLAATPPAPARRLQIGPAFWTVTGALSLIVNAVLIALLLSAAQQLGRLRATSEDAASSLVAGLYTNFERMDQAHIRTTIPVKAEVPVTLTVCIQTGTDVVLNRDVTITNARVTVETGGLNIDRAATTILLPENTSLPVNLDLCVPVQASVPIDIAVPVDIPVASTELHDSILGLQETIKPLYCLVEPNAASMDGTPICR